MLMYSQTLVLRKAICIGKNYSADHESSRVNTEMTTETFRENNGPEMLCLYVTRLALLATVLMAFSISKPKNIVQ